MGKKTDKSIKEKASAPAAEEVINKTPEPYQCVGNFATDFTELFRERNMGFQIPIIIKNKRGFSPSRLANDSNTSYQTGKKAGKDDKKVLPQHPTDPEQISPEDKEIINYLGFKPKTFAVKPTYSALKPALFVETDNIDKPDNVAEISIRRWKVDLLVLELLGTCFAAVTKLTTITFWRVGLTSEAISQLAETLSKCETIKFLTIENNDEAKLENYHELIKPGSNLVKLYLRYCNVSPLGAKLISEELGTLASLGNTKLLVLDLNGCPLGDFGALSLAKALRINRTLLSLSLSNCDIGDLACVELAKSVSRYLLTDEEIYARRQMMSDRSMSESAKSCNSRESIVSTNISPPLSRRGDPKERPVSVRSSSKDDKGKKDKGNAAKGKKEVKDEKHEKPPAKGKKEDKSPTVKKVALDVSKQAAKGKGGKSGRLSKTANQNDSLSDVASENMENIHPLLNKVEAIEPGKLLINGNYALIILNLSRNRISEEGLDELHTAISYQQSLITSAKNGRLGLLKLFLQGNRFEELDEKYVKIQTLLTSRDPKAKNATLETE